VRMVALLIFILCLVLLFRYLNYRTTKYLVNEGFYNFHNWFDERAWYPLGRIIGGTIYPGSCVCICTFYSKCRTDPKLRYIHTINIWHIPSINLMLFMVNSRTDVHRCFGVLGSPSVELPG